MLISTLAGSLRRQVRCPCVYVYNHVGSMIGSAIRLIYCRCDQTSTNLHTDIQACIRFQSWTFDVDNSTSRFTSSFHLKLGLQRWQLLLKVYQFGRQVQLLGLQVVDLAISKLSSLKQLAALLLHTSPPITISNANSFTGRSHRSSILQPEQDAALCKTRTSCVV